MGKGHNFTHPVAPGPRWRRDRKTLLKAGPELFGLRPGRRVDSLRNSYHFWNMTANPLKRFKGFKIQRFI
jgi:hypothetical protein